VCYAKEGLQKSDKGKVRVLPATAGTCRDLAIAVKCLSQCTFFASAANRAFLQKTQQSLAY
jgi:hypothetical protein